MILAVDIGNSTVVMGLINENGIFAYKKSVTDISEIEVSYKDEMSSFIKESGISTNQIKGGIISSVVPLLTDILKDAVYEITSISPLMVNYQSKTGIKIRTNNPEKLGSDRITDAAAAATEYNAPFIVIDMGTATTISVVNKQNEFIGGLILPGVKTSLNSLIGNTSQLPLIKLNAPEGNIIGSDTVSAITNGVIFGTAAQLDGLISRLADELGYLPKIIVTGGNSSAIVPYCKSEIIHDKQLLLKGLYTIYKNEKECI